MARTRRMDFSVIVLLMILLNSFVSLTSADDRIVGGNQAEIGEYPYFVYVQYTTISGAKYNCGGTLIAPDIVLTAAHCEEGLTVVEYRIVIGAYKRTSLAYGAQARICTQYVNHPQYAETDGFADKDFALCKLNAPVTTILDFVALNRETTVPADGEDVVTIGLGYLKDPDEQYAAKSEFLQEVTLRVENQGNCDLFFSTQITDNMVCAIGPETGGRKDICVGDSGGPLLLLQGGVPTLIGVTSFGAYKCGSEGAPSVYARVSSEYNWIRETSCDATGLNSIGALCNDAPTSSPTTTPPLPTTAEGDLLDTMKMLFAGDSDIDYWNKTRKKYPTSKNKGVGGSTCKQWQKDGGRMDRWLTKFSPPTVVLVCGENDMAEGDTPAETFENFKKVVKKVAATGATTIYLGTKPEPGTTNLHADYRTYDGLIRDYYDGTQTEPFIMIDVYPGFVELGNPQNYYRKDDLHMSGKGYKKWNQWLRTVLKDRTGCLRWKSGVCVLMAPDDSTTSTPTSTPTTGSPTSAPTSSPTSFPTTVFPTTTESPTDCSDDAKFRYKNKPKKDCNWVKNRVLTHCKRSHEGKLVKEYCPKTCGECRLNNPFSRRSR